MVIVVITIIMTILSNFEHPQKQVLRQAWLQVDYWEEGDPVKYYNGNREHETYKREKMIECVLNGLLLTAAGTQSYWGPCPEKHALESSHWGLEVERERKNQKSWISN